MAKFWFRLVRVRIKYAKRVNVAPSPFSAGAGRILDEFEDVVEEEVEGITMTSVLFCKHGRLIMPVTSGQTDDELLVILSKNREELTNEELKILGADFQKADENERTKIFKYLFFPTIKSGRRKLCRKNIEWTYFDIKY